MARVGILSLWLVLGVAEASAQMRPRLLGNVPQSLAEYLELTAEQTVGIRQINLKFNSIYGAQQERLSELSRELGRLRESPVLDEAAISRVHIEIETIQKKLWGAMGDARKDSLALLTNAQKEKLRSIEVAASMLPRIHDAICANLIPGELPRGSSRGFGGTTTVFSPSTRTEGCTPAAPPIPDFLRPQ